MQRHQPAQHARGFKVLGSTDRAQAAAMTLQPGQSTGGPDNRHENADQWLYVISGRGRATVAGQEVTLEPGDLICIEAGEAHEIAGSEGEGNEGSEPLVTFSIYAPPAY